VTACLDRVVGVERAGRPDLALELDQAALGSDRLDFVATGGQVVVASALVACAKASQPILARYDEACGLFATPMTPAVLTACLVCS